MNVNSGFFLSVCLFAGTWLSLSPDALHATYVPEVRVAYRTSSDVAYSAFQEAPQFIIVDLGTPNLFPESVNDKAQVLLGTRHRLVNGGVEQLGGTSPWGTGINEKGYIFGMASEGPGGASKNAVWPASSSFPATKSLPNGISEKGHENIAAFNDLNQMMVTRQLSNFGDWFSNNWWFHSESYYLTDQGWELMAQYSSESRFGFTESGTVLGPYGMNNHGDFVARVKPVGLPENYFFNTNYILTFQPSDINDLRTVVGRQAIPETNLWNIMVRDRFGVTVLEPRVEMVGPVRISNPTDGLEEIIMGGHYWRRMAKRGANGNPTNEPGHDFIYAYLDDLIDPASGWFDLSATSISANGIIAGRGSYLDRATGETSSRAFVLLRKQPALLPDYNRDGVIDGKDRLLALRKDAEGKPIPFHFWINDDNDNVNYETSGDDTPGNYFPDHMDKTVQGTRDLTDFCPLFLDFSEILNELDLTKVEMFFLGDEVNYVEPVQVLPHGLSPDQAGAYLTDPQTAHSLRNAGKKRAHAPFSVAFLEEVKAGRGVVLLEGLGKKPWQTPTRLVMDYDGIRIVDTEVPIRFFPVEDMYRRINLVHLLGESHQMEPFTGDPPGWPDSLTRDRYFVFLHGFNVSQQKARGWHAQMFKRLFWSGSNARFVGVTWHGDVAPNYYKGVKNAFITSESLASNLGFIDPAKMVIAGHSLGNMVVSSAIRSAHSFKAGTGPTWIPDQYFLLNAAVPVESYDATQTTGTGGSGTMWDNIRNPDWAINGVNYHDRLTATYWHNLFLDGSLDNNGNPVSGDKRQYLTWSDRFAGFDFATNFYSSGEEVLQNAAGSVPGVLSFDKAPEAWTSQEMRKGITGLHSPFLKPTHGGWGMAEPESAPYWTGDWSTGWTIFSPLQMNATDGNGDWVITDAQLRETPFFRPFLPKEDHIYDGPSLLAPLGDSLASTIANMPFTHYKLLAEAIPARSFAAGANAMPRLNILAGESRNHDMQDMQVEWPAERPAAPGGGKPWLHSDLKDVAYLYVYHLFDNIVEKGSLR